MRIEVTLPTAIVAAAESVEGEGESPRTIKGLALPFGVEATVSTGQRVKFTKGSVSLEGAPVVLHHAPDRPVGVVVNESLTDEALEATARISKVRDGDEALVLASDGVLRGWSVGVNPTEFTEDEEGVMTVTASQTDHLALVMSPAYESARISQVAAAAAQQKESPVPDDATTEKDAPTTVAAAPRTPTVQAGLPSMGEWMKAVTEQKRDPERFAAVSARIQAATGDVTLDPNLDGWAEVPYVGQAIDLAAPAERPLSEAFGILSGPSGVKSFVRPRVTGHLADAATGAELADMTDDGTDTDTDTVTMTFIKRAANVSAEAQAFSSPDVYALVGRDLVRSYLRGFEARTAAAIAAIDYTGRTTAIAQATLAADLYEAAAGIFDAGFPLPNLFAVGSDLWAELGGFVDSDGRPIFPYLSPSNAPGNSQGVTGWGQNILGLRPVVVRGLTGVGYLAHTEAVEVYESSRVSMGPVSDPTVLGTAWGIGGAHGVYNIAPAGLHKFTVGV